MDELYDNLDNYEDLKLIEQLKTENMALKNKLEEYSIAMDNLQKDFDRVSSDFKKMEMNYSSLLKTAKVEIERKTKIIKDLNMEKDMIVLKALQNKNQLDHRSLRNITKPFQKGPMTDSTYGKKNIAPTADNLKAKCDNGVARKDDTRFSSVDTVTSCNTDITGRLLKLASRNVESAETWSDRTSDTKENMTKKDVEDSSGTNTRALSIRNRRKSMPAVRSQDKFSSDEDCEDTYSRNEPYKKCFPSREDNRQNMDKYSDRFRHKGLEEKNKVSETSSVDDRYPSYEPNRDTYQRSRNDKYGVDKHRTKDRYDNTQRQRRYLSPDRSRRTTRNDDYYQRQEYGRHRFLESPPPDKFHHYQQRNRESRSKHDRDDPFDCNRRNRQQEKYSSKHKMVSEPYEEPTSKRQKTDSFSKYPEEEKRWIRDKGVPLERSVSDLLEEMPQYTSCQSPDDYLLSDESSPLPVKEIMNTATTPLEDPRTHSQKYILKTVENNAELSTITGRNVDLKMVDLSKWATGKVDVSEAKQKSPPYSVDIVKEIYMDIDNPVSNMSVESGEIWTCNEDESDEKDVVKKDQSQINTNIPRKEQSQHYNEGSTKDHSKNDSEKSKRDKSQGNAERHNEKVEKDASSMGGAVKSAYRIPKIKNKNQEIPNQTNINRAIEKEIPLTKTNKSSDGQRKNCRPMTSRTSVDHEKINLTDNKSKENVTSQASKHKNYFLPSSCKESLTVAKEIVAGDLELSDETSDNIDIQEKALIQNAQIKDLKPLENKSDVKIAFENKIEEHKSPENQKVESKPSDLVKDESKKHKSKKRTSKIKDAAVDKIDDGLDVKEKVKKTRDKKNKFNELFGGDSNSIFTPEDFGNSSLITPDDLGIATDSQAQQKLAVNYLPICEDAQDAVDINVSKAAKVQNISMPKSIESNEIIEVINTKNNKSEKVEKAQSKAVNETKKKKSRKSDNECIISVDIPLYCNEHIESSQNLAVDATKPEEPIIISPIEPQLASVAKVTEVIQQEPVHALSIAKNMLHRPDGLLNALATSTPQKVDVATSEFIAPDNSVNENLESMDSVADSSTAEIPDAQKDTDVPDVRIFVKRRRRVVKKS